MIDELARAVEQLLARANTTMAIRLVIQPITAIVLALRAGLIDARTNKPAFLQEFLFHPESRMHLIASMWKDIGRLFLLAFAIDVVYQFIILKNLYLLQALIVAVALAVVPYIIFRGPITRIARWYKKRT